MTFLTKSMIQASLTLLFTSFAISSHAGLAGGVGSGGGGTTNPDPTTPERVASAVYYYGGPAVRAWLNAEEGHYHRKSESEKATSPFRKLFEGKETIFDLVGNVQVELHFNEPCYDLQGKPRDGSIHASTPGAICLSPFTMAPKLNDSNVRDETLALLVHELSHLMGADETEAEEIQKHAIWAFDDANFLRFLSKPDLTINRLNGVLSTLHSYSLSPQFVDSRDIERIVDAIMDIRREIQFDFNFTFLMLREPEIESLTASTVRYNALRDYVCSVDPREYDSVREYCRDKVEKAFAGGEEVVSARTYLARTDGGSYADSLGVEYDHFEIQRIYDHDGIKHELKKAGEELKVVLDQIVKHSETDFPIIRK